VVGEIIGDCLTKRVRKSKHLLIKPLGWAWDTNILKAAVTSGVTKTELFDIESQLIFTASLLDFEINGIQINRGFGCQTVLPLMYWQRRPIGSKNFEQLSLAT
jgi:hypothetical protein